ncbi:DUF3152 domain-containing protein [Nocardiopsis ansamitocini]|uniref:DUF3152 domain-containing protein n=1 Tax=Nocardiopsis ansamitocini TaxID=1670832 RepID=UPI003D7FBC5F
MAMLSGLALATGGLGVLISGGLDPERFAPHSPVAASSPSERVPGSVFRPPIPAPSPTPVLSRSVVDEVTEGSGDLKVVKGKSEVYGSGPLKRFIVEVEDGLPGEADDFAAAVERILGDERSWGHEGAMSFQRVDSGSVDFRVSLAAPTTVDEHCAPLRTNGYVSCQQGDRAVINQNRWVSAVPHFDGDLESYRVYVINHEVGHALGHGHVDCPKDGVNAPVMQQQTFGLQGCERNGWVHP